MWVCLWARCCLCWFDFMGVMLSMCEALCGLGSGRDSAELIPVGGDSDSLQV